MLNSKNNKHILYYVKQLNFMYRFWVFNKTICDQSIMLYNFQIKIYFKLAEVFTIAHRYLKY